MMDEFYENLCKRLSVPDGHVLTYDEVMRWPEGKLDELVLQGKVKEGTPSETIVCVECSEKCLIEPDVRRHPETAKLFGVYVCPNDEDIGRITVDLERKKRWEIVVPSKIRDFDTVSEAFGKDWDHYNLSKNEVVDAVEGSNLADLIAIVIKDLVYWAISVKRHMLKLMQLYEAGDTGFINHGFVPYWFGREIVGMHETFEMLEFHKSVEYAKAFASKFDKFLQARKDFIDLAISFKGTAKTNEYLEFWVAVDECRKDLKDRAFSLADHLKLLHAQFAGSTVSNEASVNASRTAGQDKEKPSKKKKATKVLKQALPANYVLCKDVAAIVRKRSDSVARSLKNAHYPVVKVNRKAYCDPEHAAVIFQKWKKYWTKKIEE